MVRLAVNLDAMLGRIALRSRSSESALDDLVGAASLAELGGADAIALALRGQVAPEIRDALRCVRDAIATKLCLRVHDPEAAAAAIEVGPATLVIEARHFELFRESARARDISVFASGVADTDLVLLRDRGVDGIEVGRTEVEEDRSGFEAMADRANELGLAVAIDAAEADFDTIAGLVGIRAVSRIEVGAALVTRAILVGMARATTELRYLVNRSRSLEPRGRVSSAHPEPVPVAGSSASRERAWRS